MGTRSNWWLDVIYKRTKQGQLYPRYQLLSDGLHPSYELSGKLAMKLIRDILDRNDANLVLMSLRIFLSIPLIAAVLCTYLLSNIIVDSSVPMVIVTVILDTLYYLHYYYMELGRSAEKIVVTTPVDSSVPVWLASVLPNSSHERTDTGAVLCEPLSIKVLLSPVSYLTGSKYENRPLLLLSTLISMLTFFTNRLYDYVERCAETRTWTTTPTTEGPQVKRQFLPSKFNLPSSIHRRPQLNFSTPLTIGTRQYYRISFEFYSKFVVTSLQKLRWQSEPIYERHSHTK